ncbi:hypothetical protein HYH03_013725 [Edaphochlamys debaryana]|uniref:Uncharacterized protein n=1 Tax=Edaphochlamys debaryana TaxID=47281 RepID=A0A835XPM4_9CHLO|nr:hypothetical protein HYH03_013725 [Edaphochlamys debaryana]|eukprot:KAG2487726.1 hypothetical protein HYH03_013725 [Edaphochlamys debaryana]
MTAAPYSALYGMPDLWLYNPGGLCLSGPPSTAAKQAAAWCWASGSPKSVIKSSVSLSVSFRQPLIAYQLSILVVGSQEGSVLSTPSLKGFNATVQMKGNADVSTRCTGSSASDLPYLVLFSFNLTDAPVQGATLELDANAIIDSVSLVGQPGAVTSATPAHGAKPASTAHPNAAQPEPEPKPKPKPEPPRALGCRVLSNAPPWPSLALAATSAAISACKHPAASADVRRVAHFPFSTTRRANSRRRPTTPTGASAQHASSAAFPTSSTLSAAAGCLATPAYNASASAAARCPASVTLHNGRHPAAAAATWSTHSSQTKLAVASPTTSFPKPSLVTSTGAPCQLASASAVAVASASPLSFASPAASCAPPSRAASTGAPCRLASGAANTSASALPFASPTAAFAQPSIPTSNGATCRLAPTAAVTSTAALSFTIPAASCAPPSLTASARAPCRLAPASSVPASATLSRASPASYFAQPFLANSTEKPCQLASSAAAVPTSTDRSQPSFTPTFSLHTDASPAPPTPPPLPPPRPPTLSAPSPPRPPLPVFTEVQVLGLTQAMVDAQQPIALMTFAREITIVDVDTLDPEVLDAMFPGAVNVKPVAYDIAVTVDMTAATGSNGCSGAFMDSLTDQLGSSSTLNGANASCSAGVSHHHRLLLEVAAGSTASTGAGLPPVSSGTCSSGTAAPVVLQLSMPASTSSTGTTAGSTGSLKNGVVDAMEAAEAASGVHLCDVSASKVVVSTRVRAEYQVPLSELGAETYTTACTSSTTMCADCLAGCQVTPAPQSAPDGSSGGSGYGQPSAGVQADTASTSQEQGGATGNNSSNSQQIITIVVAAVGASLGVAVLVVAAVVVQRRRRREAWGVEMVQGTGNNTRVEPSMVEVEDWDHTRRDADPNEPAPAPPVRSYIDLGVFSQQPVPKRHRRDEDIMPALRNARGPLRSASAEGPNLARCSAPAAFDEDEAGHVTISGTIHTAGSSSGAGRSHAAAAASAATALGHSSSGGWGHNPHGLAIGRAGRMSNNSQLGRAALLGLHAATASGGQRLPARGRALALQEKLQAGRLSSGGGANPGPNSASSTRNAWRGKVVPRRVIANGGSSAVHPESSRLAPRGVDGDIESPPPGSPHHETPVRPYGQASITTQGSAAASLGHKVWRSEPQSTSRIPPLEVEDVASAAQSSDEAAAAKEPNHRRSTQSLPGNAPLAQERPLRYELALRHGGPTPPKRRVTFANESGGSAPPASPVAVRISHSGYLHSSDAAEAGALADADSTPIMLPSPVQLDELQELQAAAKATAEAHRAPVIPESGSSHALSCVVPDLVSTRSLSPQFGMAAGSGRWMEPGGTNSGGSTPSGRVSGLAPSGSRQSSRRFLAATLAATNASEGGGRSPSLRHLATADGSRPSSARQLSAALAGCESGTGVSRAGQLGSPAAVTGELPGLLSSPVRDATLQSCSPTRSPAINTPLENLLWDDVEGPNSAPAQVLGPALVEDIVEDNPQAVQTLHHLSPGPRVMGPSPSSRLRPMASPSPVPEVSRP